ncbi:MAG: thiamine pyrophosphate-binding protein [Bdellovibrionota bacterium]
MKDSMNFRVSDYIAHYIENLGVESVFLLSGGGMMHLLDSVSRLEKTKYYCNHHEQCCAIAADAYARKSGKLGVCYATSGPGGTNTLTGVLGAWQDSVPVLFISGQSKISQTIGGSGLNDLRQYGVFEVDIIPIVKSVTKYSVLIKDPNSIRYHLEKACYLARHGRPGPVFLDIPVDIQGAPIQPDALKGFSPEEEGLDTRLPLSDKIILDLIERIKKASRPLLLAGFGIRSANKVREFQKLVKQLNIPVVTTQLATDILPYENSLYVGHPGVKGDRAGNLSIQNADLIISLGCSLHVSTTGYEMDQFAPSAYKIQIEIDPAVLQREQVGVNQKINIDLETFISVLGKKLPQTGLSGPQKWIDYCQKIKKELSVRNEKHSTPSGKINYYDLIDALSDLTVGNETIVTDAGSGFYIVGQAYRVKGSQQVINSGSLGAMGFALPATTGACTADLKSQVICITGDGSLQTNIHELATIHHNQLNAKIFIINNDGYVSIRNTQNNFFNGHLAGTSSSSGVSFPELQKIALAYGIPYLGVREKSELNEVVQKALNTNGPVICEVFTPSNQEVIPTVSSMRMEDGSMKSKPLHEMYPFMDDETLKKYQP